MSVVYIHPSLASANHLALGEEIRLLCGSEIASLHLDIEDSSFIRNITFGLKTATQISAASCWPLSVHLMVADPFPWVTWLAPLRPKWIFAHAETLNNPSEILTATRKIGAKAGLAFNPATPLAPYDYLANRLDSVMIMTSEPDGEKLAFNERLVHKVAQAASIFTTSEIWADGGITLPSAKMLLTAGARHLVLGRAIFSANDYPRRIDQFREIANE
ncbi:epimerase [Leminorella grimontii]|uniref:Epimerase n=1 Tax=Leminorella grimontii TaxID=82981 RepID=A0AAV5MZU0_9GAMM|nr:epimerase [Leminorella grimontii]KFC97430.1 ribulose-phosphate 3-epimerase [Leminorella grimontii ATCC 33999 = DSM 5078]GKX55210.1 epimerase [Leminorella grimontii]GKX58634.1 epimerase [Leminorella grimontii]VFS56762.1 Ribulose-phosphate 3-epimerase [Leminorella grimontii]